MHDELEGMPDDYQPTEDDLRQMASELGIDPKDLSGGGEPPPAPADDDEKKTGGQEKADDPAPDEDKPADAPDDAGEGGEETPDDDQDPPAGEPDKGEVDEALTLADLKELGIGEFESLDDARKSLKHLRTALSRRDDDAAIGRYLRSRGVDPRQVDDLLSSDTPSKPKDEPARPQWDPAWEGMVKPRIDEETGQQVGWDGPEEIVRKVESFHAHQQQLWNRVYLGDHDAMREIFSPVIEAEVEKRLGAVTAKTQMDQFLEKNYDFLSSHEEEFYSLLDRGVDPEFAVEHLRLKHGETEGGKPPADPQPPADPETAKNRDLERMRKQARRGKLPPAPPAKPSDDDIDLSTMDGEEIARRAVERAGIDMSGYEG